MLGELRRRRRCSPTPGFDAAPALARHRRRSGAPSTRQPSRATSRRRDARRRAAARLGARRRRGRAATATPAIGALLAALPAAHARRAPCSASPSRRTSPSSTARRATIPWLAVCLPSRWAPEDKIGRHFAEVHAPVADNALLVAAERIAGAAGHRRRALGALRLDDQRRPAPAPASRRAAAPTGRPDGRRRCARRAGVLSHRAPDLHSDRRRAARRSSRSTSTACRSPTPSTRARRRAPRLHDAIASMSPAVLAYRGLDAGARPPARLARGARGRDAARREDGADRPGAHRLRRRRHAAVAPSTATSTTRARARSRRRATSSSTATRSPRAGAAATASSSSRPASASATTSSRPGRRGAPTRSAAAQLHFISIEASPPTRADLASLDARRGAARRWPPSWRRLAAAHLQPAPRSPSRAARVELLLAFGDGRRAGCRSSSPSVDAFFLDGFAPARNPAMWDARLFKAMARLRRAGRDARDLERRRAPCATACAAPASRSRARPAAAASATSRAAASRRASRRARRRRHGRRAAPTRRRDASDAHRRSSSSAPASPAARWPARSPSAGVRSLVARARRRASPAKARAMPPASSTASSIAATAGTRAFIAPPRSPRGAAVRAAIARHGVRGSAAGLLRVETGAATRRDAGAARSPRAAAPTTSRRSIADAASRARRRRARRRRPGTSRAAAGSIRAASRAPGSRDAGAASICACDCAVGVAAPRRRRLAASRRRRARRSPTAPVVVLCNGDGALGCGADAPGRCAASAASSAASPPATLAPTAAPRLPIAGAGYVLPAVDGTRLVRRQLGVGRRRSARCAQRRPAAQPRPPGGAARPAPRRRRSTRLGGRVGFRWASDDRLPIIGAVPAASPRAWRSGFVGARSPRFDQPRFVARAPGLFVCRRARLARHRVGGARRARCWPRRSPGRRCRPRPTCSMRSTRRAS